MHPLETVTLFDLHELMHTYRRRLNCTKAISIPDAYPCVTLPQMRLGLAGCMLYEKP